MKKFYIDLKKVKGINEASKKQINEEYNKQICNCVSGEVSFNDALYNFATYINTNFKEQAQEIFEQHL